MLPAAADVTVAVAVVTGCVVVDDDDDDVGGNDADDCVRNQGR